MASSLAVFGMLAGAVLPLYLPKTVGLLFTIIHPVVEGGADEDSK